MMLFWLRFFGAKRSASLTKSFDEGSKGGGNVTAFVAPRPRQSISYVPVNPFVDEELVPL